MPEFIQKSTSLGFINGATVEIVSAPRQDFIGGWDNCRDNDMREEVGKQFVINYVSDDGISGVDSGFLWPWWSLKLVKASTKKVEQLVADAFGPYRTGQSIFVGDESGTILGFDHTANLIHVDLGDDDTYWFNYYDVSEEIPMPAIKLNDEYTATIDVKSAIVEVGCQEISFDKVLELADTIKRVK